MNAARTRMSAPMSRLAVISLVSILCLWSSGSASAQSGSGGPDDSAQSTCAPYDPGWPCASGGPGRGPLSGEISWSELQDDPGGLGSGVIWNATISVDLVWDDQARLYAARGGSYVYDYQLTGHCTGAVAGSGVVSTELYGSAAAGIATLSGDTSGQAPGDIGFDIKIWRDDYTAHCKASPGFDATDMLDPGMGVRPWCTRVLGTLVADSSATYTMSCNEPQVPEIHETIGGTLTQAP